MNNFPMPHHDPIQQGFRKKLEAQGVKFSSDGENRFLTAEEWFQKRYHGQTNEALPAYLKEEYSLEELESLRAEYDLKNKQVSEKNINKSQLEIDLQEEESKQ